MASATPDLRLPSQSHDIAALRLVQIILREAHVCEQFAHDRYLTVKRPEVELVISRVASQRPNHYITRPHKFAAFVVILPVKVT